MKRPVDQPEHGKLVHKAVLHGNYQFSNAIFYYDEEEKIADVAIGKLNIQAGEKIAILGRNGAGKSTLLQMLAGMRIAQQGQVLLDNISIGQLDPADLRRDMGLLSQTGRLFFGSLRENLTMGMPEASDEDIERALTLSGALPFVQKQKNGLNYMIQEGDLASLVVSGKRCCWRGCSSLNPISCCSMNPAPRWTKWRKRI